ncbi:MAG TPA: isoprenylcysteine carboxylmethyltransferase family protein [Blastocatellia bacterium]|nr:isoprenylcysteine carboxylmethyltransferase family protein [Blastocatellia bacterium]
MLNSLSLVGLLLMIAALAGLWFVGTLFTYAPLVIVIQALAVLLMVWARFTFGHRSFHATANPTAGGIVTSGPYRYIRHPIYTAGCLIGWVGILAHPSFASAGLGLVLFGGALMRMLSEEQLVSKQYPEYTEYMARTKRMIPFVF